jgi:hypothetical protein
MLPGCHPFAYAHSNPVMQRLRGAAAVVPVLLLPSGLSCLPR